MQQSNFFPTTRSRAGYSVDFLKWWEAYPRKVGKLRAEKCYALAVKQLGKREGMRSNEAQARLLQAAKDFRLRAEKMQPEFVPHPATWLAQGRWDDEPDQPLTSTTAASVSAGCPICGGTGTVEVVNPVWLQREFGHDKAMASNWCRKNKAGPIVFGVRCSCRSAVQGRNRYSPSVFKLASTYDWS